MLDIACDRFDVYHMCIDELSINELALKALDAIGSGFIYTLRYPVACRHNCRCTFISCGDTTTKGLIGGIHHDGGAGGIYSNVLEKLFNSNTDMPICNLLHSANISLTSKQCLHNMVITWIVGLDQCYHIVPQNINGPKPIVIF